MKKTRKVEMFLLYMRVWLIMFILLIDNVYAKENHTTFSKVFTSHSDTYNIGTAIFSPEGRYLISGATELVIWDLKEDKEVKHVFADSKGIISLSFSPDGRYLLSSGHSNIIKLWDTNTWKVIKKFYNDTESNYLAFSPDMKYILSGGVDSSVNWSFDSKRYIQKYGTWHYTLWDIESHKKIKDFNQTVDDKTLVQFGIVEKDTKPLRISMSVEEQRKMYRQIEKMQKIRNDFERVRFATYSPDKKQIVSLHFIAIQGSYLGALVLWDAQTMQIVKEFKESPISHSKECDIGLSLNIPFGQK